MFFGKDNMKGVTFCFFVDACHSGWFAEFCNRYEHMFKGNSVIAYTSCAAGETAPRVDPDPAHRTKYGITSQFTMALMSILDGPQDYPILNIKYMQPIIQARLRLPYSAQVQAYTFNAKSSFRISKVLRTPASFPWYKFDRSRFVAYWPAAQQALVAMTGRTIDSCPKLDMSRCLRGRRPKLTIPRPTRRVQPRSVPQSGSNGLEHRKHGLSKSDREMIRRLVIKYYFQQVQELIWKYYIMEHIWLLGFHW